MRNQVSFPLLNFLTNRGNIVATIYVAALQVLFWTIWQASCGDWSRDE